MIQTNVRLDILATIHQLYEEYDFKRLSYTGTKFYYALSQVFVATPDIFRNYNFTRYLQGYEDSKEKI